MFLHCLFLSGDNTLPCFSNTVLDLFLNIFVIFLKIWDRHEVNVCIKFSLHHFCISDHRDLCIFSFLPHIYLNWLTVRKKNHLFLQFHIFWNVFCSSFFTKCFWLWSSCYLEIRREMVKGRCLKEMFDMYERLCLSKCLSNKAAFLCVKLKVGTAILRFIQRLSFNP